MPNRNNLPADITLKPHGIRVPGSLQINEMTLHERRFYAGEGAKTDFTEEDARRAGYSEDDIRREYGPSNP